MTYDDYMIQDVSKHAIAHIIIQKYSYYIVQIEDAYPYCKLAIRKC